MSLTELVVAALAVWEIVEIWHHSSLTAGWRAQAEVVEGWSGKLLTCPFCLSVWTALLLVLPPLLLPVVDAFHAAQNVFAGAVWSFVILWRWLVYSLAVARLANIGNDLCCPWCRTPKDNKAVPTPPPPTETVPGAVAVVTSNPLLTRSVDVEEHV